MKEGKRVGVILLTLASMIALTLAATGSAGTGDVGASANGRADGPAPFVMSVAKGATVTLDSSAGSSSTVGAAPLKNEFKASKRTGKSPLRTAPGADGPKRGNEWE